MGTIFKIMGAHLRHSTYGLLSRGSKEHCNKESWASGLFCEEAAGSIVFNSAELALREVSSLKLHAI